MIESRSGCWDCHPVCPLGKLPSAVSVRTYGLGLVAGQGESKALAWDAKANHMSINTKLEDCPELQEIA